MRPHMLVISLVLTLLTLGLILFLVATYKPPAGVLSDGQGSITRIPDEPGVNPYADFHVPEFELIDRNGDPITHAALDGRYTVLDFFFSSCPLWCPGMTAAMARVQNETAGTSARLMSVSIDGEVDTPAIISRYANDYGADPERWDFVTGDPDVVADIVRNGLRFEIGDESIDPRTGGRIIDHPTRLILVGPDRRVVGLYRFDDPDDIEELIAAVKRLAP
ncbi:MAG: SCO family protein [Phycisphaerales bacterium]|nr:SCO family protein [Planctomycetota bacterium]MCH8507754.1 SCO family protein [Phycisphaerales bacterium]